MPSERSGRVPGGSIRHQARHGDRIHLCSSVVDAADHHAANRNRVRPGSIRRSWHHRDQILLNTFIGGYYPASCRTTGLGIALAVGRLGAIVGPTYGGLFVAAGAGTTTQLLAFALPAIAGAAVTVSVPAGRRIRSKASSTSDKSTALS